MKKHYLLRVMKLTFMFILIGLIHANASIYSQTITLQKKNLSLTEVASEIRKQTGYVISGSSTVLKNANRVSVNVVNMSLDNFLDLVFVDKNITYKKEGKSIVLSGIASTPHPLQPLVLEIQERQIDVTGVVTDSVGKPISGASVTIVGTRTGTATDASGQFTLPNVPESARLSFKSIGYSDLQMRPSVNMRVVLSMQIGNINEVIVNTGYQKISQERATGATTTITSGALDSRFTPNIMSNLEGRVAGLVNYGDQMTIRGTGTLFAESRPLLVVDGLPVEMSYEDLNPYDVESITILKDAAAAAIYGARASNGVIIIATKRATELNKIEFEVSSNLMAWQKRNVDYADNWYMTPSQQVDLEDGYWRWHYNDAPTAANNLTATGNAIAGTGNHSMNINPIQYAHYQLKTGAIQQAELNNRLAQYRTQNFAKDYADNILKNRMLQMHNLAVRSRTNNFQSNLILNYKGDNTGTIHDRDDQLNVFYKGTYDMAKWLSVNFSVNNILHRSTERRRNDVENTLDPFALPAYYSLFNPDGSQANISPGWTHYYNPYATWVEDSPASLRPMHYHILDELKLNKHKTERQNTRYHGELLFRIIEGLSVNTQYVYEVNRQSVANNSEEDSYVMRLMRNVYTAQNPNGTYRYLLPPNGGKLATENRQGDHWTARAQVNFNRVIADVHAVDFLAGIEFRETNTKGVRNLYLGWDDQLQTQATTTVNYNELWLINNTSNTSPFAPSYPARQFIFTPLIQNAINNIPEIRHRNSSGYANITYTYDRRYNLFASIRKDYADVFGLATAFRGSPFGSVGLSWNLHHEGFMNRFRELNTLKLRTSYGYTGNIYQGATSFMTATTGQTNTNTGLPRATIESPGNPELSWERTGTINIGTEFTAFNHRLRGVLDWYNKKSEKVFSNQTLESTTGFSSLPMNMANLKNNGIELTLAYDWLRPQNRDQLSWTTSSTASWNKNEVTKVEIQANSAFQVVNIGYKEGSPVRSLFSYRFAGLTEEGVQSWYAEDGRIIPTVTIQSAAPGSVYFTGQADPKYTFAMENRLAWRGVSLNLMMVYYGGHHMRANPVQINISPGAAPVRSWYLDAWTPTNTDTNIPGIWQYNVANSTQPAVQNNTDIFVHAADFFKIRNLVLGYDLPRQTISRVGLNGLSFRFQIDNLPALYKSNDIGVDPETLGLRLPTNYVFGLNFRF